MLAEPQRIPCLPEEPRRYGEYPAGIDHVIHQQDGAGCDRLAVQCKEIKDLAHLMQGIFHRFLFGDLLFFAITG